MTVFLVSLMTVFSASLWQYPWLVVWLCSLIAFFWLYPWIVWLLYSWLAGWMYSLLVFVVAVFLDNLVAVSWLI